MVALQDLQTAGTQGSAKSIEYRCQADLNLYDSPECSRLATQAAKGRQLRVQQSEFVSLESSSLTAVPICLCEDDYPAWLSLQDLDGIALASTPYQAIAVSPDQIKTRLPAVIWFAKTALRQPNTYLWGGTIGPNYDCSGLIQAAFADLGIWLPRDAYQQEGFTQAIPLQDLEPGDLVFFGSPEKATHVGLYLGAGAYIHSSGKEQGRNGIGIDQLSGEGDPVSQTYFAQLRGSGRVMASYLPISQRPNSQRPNFQD
ncbi:MAG: NlpC/P60 family protein [Leptolyngbyaceae bacterium]|nr:NlpC/P60 family protein [Leptolyngbyaceae bacterium]